MGCGVAALRQQTYAAAAFPGGAVLHHDRVSQLRAEQAALRQHAKLVAQRLRNEPRKRRRLIEKARILNIENLVTFLDVRAATKAKAKT